MLNEQATRCPSCATVFRVAQAQLLAYNGWVRCGRCQEVFNAEKCLVELDPVAAPATKPTHSAQAAHNTLAVGERGATGSGGPGQDFDLRFDAPAQVPVPTPMAQPTPAPTLAQTPYQQPTQFAPAPYQPAPAPPTYQPAPVMAPRLPSGVGTSFGEDNMVERAVRAMRASQGLAPPVEVQSGSAQYPFSPGAPTTPPYRTAPPPAQQARHETPFYPPIPATVPELPEPPPFGQAPQPQWMAPPLEVPASAPWPPSPPAPLQHSDGRTEPFIEPAALAPAPALLHEPTLAPPSIEHPIAYASTPPDPSPEDDGLPPYRSGDGRGQHFEPVPDDEPVWGAPADLAAALTAGADAPAQAQATPSFVRHAEAAARWRSPKVMLGMALASLVLLLTLGLQAVFEYRDLVAAKFEVTRSALEKGCALFGCTVGAPHLLDADGLSVENSGLVRVEKTNTYKLNVALRNRASTAVALPALELSLTDSQGKLMARRVLRAADFGVTQNTVPAGRELGLQATLQTAFSATTNPSQEPVAGYTIELFYP